MSLDGDGPARPGRSGDATGITHARVLATAVPIMLANVSVPLIGFVDTAVIGQLGAAHLMGAVAVSAIIFNMLYWTFSFLRMGTTGLTAQALGAGDRREIAGHLLRALLVALVAGFTLIVLQRPIRAVAFWLIGGSGEVEAAAHLYYDIRIWAAPAGLVNFALLGWLIGLGRAGVALTLQLLLNALNMGLAALFVLALDMGVAGVGWAALVAEYAAAGTGLATAAALLRRMSPVIPIVDALDRRKLMRALSINADLTVRSLAGYAALILFTQQGAAAGDVVLAANALLINIQNVTIYLLDGFAFAAEALVGRAIGARNAAAFWRAVRLTTLWAAALGVLASLGIWIGGPAIIELSTTSADVRAAAETYLIWAALAPLVGVWCFQLDGIFVGATRTADMRNMMIVSVAVFFLAYALLAPAFSIHGLWAAFTVLFLTRALTLLLRLPALVRASLP